MTIAIHSIEVTPCNPNRKLHRLISGQKMSRQIRPVIDHKEQEDKSMSELVAVTYPDVYRAGEVCAILQRLQREFLIEMEDAAYITREANGKVKLHQTTPI